MGERTSVVVAVVLLAVLGTVAGVGTASATLVGADQPVYASHSDEDSESNGVDDHLGSDELVWQGQRLSIEDPNDELEAEQLLLRAYDTDANEVGPAVREFEFDANGTVLETDSLAGTYVLVPSDSRNRTVVVDDGSVTGTVDVEQSRPFEVLEQTLSVGWEGGTSGTSGSDREVELASNRVRYNVNVSSPSLSFDELEQVFMGDRTLREHNGPFADRTPFGQRHRMYDTYADEDIIVLRGFSDGSLETNFGAIETFPDAITVEVTDTGLSESAALPSESTEGGPFTISALEVSDRVDPGESVTIAATVTNEWSTTEARTVTVELGEMGSSVETELDGGDETTVSAMLPAPQEPGEVDYIVSTDGDRVEETVTVEGDEPATDDTAESEESDDSGGIVSTLIGLLYPQALIGAVMTVLSVATFVVWRRR